MFYLEREYKASADTVLDSLIYHLKQKGYVVVADINVKSILKKALDYDFGEYQILEICNPKAAKEILENDYLNGLFIPCKIIVYEDGKTTKLKLLRISEVADKFFDRGKKLIEKYQVELEKLIESFVP
jgi:uncharacterized protein (DUF302 family)